MAGVYLPSSFSRPGTGDDEVKVSVRSVQPWRERTHPHQDLHLLPKSAVSMETKSPAYGMGEPLAPLPLSSFTPFSHFPALPCPSCTSAFPGVPHINAPQSPPPISLLRLPCDKDTVGTLLCQPRAHRHCLLWHSCQAAPAFCLTHLPTFS